MSKQLLVWTSQNGDVLLTSALLAQILGGAAGALVSTPISTVGNGTLPAAALVGGQIGRTGPVAAFTDTTDTAAAIVAALGGFSAGQTFQVRIKNATGFTDTLAGGTGVTFGVGPIVAPMSAGLYFGTVGGTAASPTVTFTHIITTAIYNSQQQTNEQATALTTVGAGALTVAGMAGGVTTRGGTQTAVFADTTDTGPNIIAGIPSLVAVVGSSVEWTYVNNTVFPATITANATGVALTGSAVVPANSWAKYLITRNAAATVTMVCIGQGFFPKSGTVTANAATPVPVTDAAVTANSQIVLTYKSGTQGATGAFVSSVTPGTGFSIKSVTSDTAIYNYTILG